MHQGKKKFIILTGLVASMGGILIAIGLQFNESAADKERKPDLISQIIPQSLSICDQQHSQNTKSDTYYETRLRDALNSTLSKDLDFIIENDITICLDRRIGDLSKRFFESAVHGLYYPTHNTLSLYDDGKACSYYNNLFDAGSCAHTSRLLNAFKETYATTLPTQLTSIQYGYNSTYKGKTSTWWKPNAEKHPDLIERKELLMPPTR